MVPSGEATPARVVPTRLSVALAIAILKTKPDVVTVRAYILQLREQLKQGRQHITHDHLHRHLDQVAFWKARYDESQLRCQELERVTTQLKTTEVQDEIDTVFSSIKRRRGASAPKRTSKRAKPSLNGADISTPINKDPFASDPGTLECLPEGRSSISFTPDADQTMKEGEELVRHLYVTHQSFKQQDVDPRSMCFSLVQTARSIGSVISTIPKHHERLKMTTARSGAKHKSELAKVIEVSAKAFASILVGLGKVANIKEHHLPGLVIFECVKTFTKALDSISESARIIAKARSPAQSNKSNINQIKAPLSTNESGPIRPIAQFLNAVISHLDKTEPHHRQIFEGMLFVTLERVGKLLFYCTFNRHRSETIEGDIATATTHESKMLVAEHMTEATAIQLEIRALITILERALALAPYHLNSPPTSSSSASKAQKTSSVARTSTVRTLTPASRAPLSAHAKDRLQRTLVTCMFGEKVRDEFSDVLRMPAVLESMPNLPKPKDESVEDWFNGEVWRLIGWDLLSREDQW